MRRKSLLIPILVFILSFGILFFYQKSNNTVTLANTTQLPPVLWSKSNADISKIVYAISNKKMSVERQNGQWTLSNINNKPADSLYIYTIIDSFLEPHFKEVVAISPDDLSIYGIEEASPTITLYDKEGEEYSIIKGSPVDNTLTYVYTPISDTVYTMDSRLFSPLSLTPTDWLNKQLLSFDLDQIKKVTFAYKGVETTLLPTQTENGITFSSSSMNDVLCNKFIAFLQNSKIEQFITDNASEHILQVYGFTAPRLRCTIYLNSGENLSLVIGDIKASENICYAMVNHNNAIVAIPYFDFSQFDSLFAEYQSNDSFIIG